MVEQGKISHKLLLHVVKGPVGFAHAQLPRLGSGEKQGIAMACV